MATKKDLVEAYAFSRRRLVTAFVSGAPGRPRGRARPAGPHHRRRPGPGRPAHRRCRDRRHLLPAGPRRLDEAGPDHLQGDGRGLRHHRLGGRRGGGPPILRPVINITSARLILGGGDQPRIVPQEAIDEQASATTSASSARPRACPRPGAARRAPAGRACTADGGGIRITVAEPSPVAAEPSGSFLVRRRPGLLRGRGVGGRGGRAPTAPTATKRCRATRHRGRTC